MPTKDKPQELLTAEYNESMWKLHLKEAQELVETCKRGVSHARQRRIRIERGSTKPLPKTTGTIETTLKQQTGV